MYLVQDLIKGQNVEQELQQQGVFSEDKVQEVLLEILPILSFIHQNQIIHRDIKPDHNL